MQVIGSSVRNNRCLSDIYKVYYLMRWLPILQVYFDHNFVVNLLWFSLFKKRSVVNTLVSSLWIYYGTMVWPSINCQQFIWQCKEYHTNGRLTADCSKQEKDIGVPTNLNPMIEVLNLSGNKLIHITGKSFERYKDNLIVLDLSKSKTDKRKYDANAFTSLSKLLYLNLSGTCLLEDNIHIENQEFPSTIIEFVYSNCGIVKNINLSSIDDLEVYIGSEGYIPTFPIFSITSPLIRFVNLANNPLDELRPIDMAPYCELEEVIIETEKYHGHQGLTHELKYCQCMKVRRWLDYAKIKYWSENLKCNGYVPNCDHDKIDPKAIEMRTKCQTIITSKPKARFKWVLMFLKYLAVLLFLLAILLLFLLRQYFWRKENIFPPPPETVGEEELEDEGGQTTEIPQLTVEDENPPPPLEGE